MSQSLRLFDQFVRTDHRPASRSEPDFTFMNRSAWPAYENIREVFERWFADYPASDRNHLCTRFRKEDQSHAAAFFELYLHQVLSRLGLSPEVHPRPEFGRGRPDFAITSVNGSRCYIEANVVLKPRWDSANPLENEFLNAIDAVAELQPTQIGVAVSTKGTLKRSHQRRPVQRQVQEWLDSIDPVDLSLTDFDHNPRLCIRRDDWVAELVAFGPLPRLGRRLIQMGPIRTGFLNEGPLLADSLKAKVKRFGTLDRSLILAINTSDVFTSGGDEHEALLGTQCGVWRTDSAARPQRLHGVLFFRGLLPSNMHDVAAHMYLNPNAQADIPEELLKLSSMRQCNGEWQLKKGMSLGEILELPKDWPGEVTASKWQAPSQ
ncbi:MAG: hypothetical protein F4W95_15180 [Chloroflexi bacterium]|nr:hypothetical protein [Acidimicrobiia bacterium]MYD49800.1 hypothetical protein [Chloroflexota bacterium]